MRLLRREGAKLALAVDHVEGKVINELVVRPPDAIDLWEEKRRYDASFLNRFKTIRGECLDWTLVLGGRHLLRLLRVHVCHYNEQRPHRRLALRVPMPGELA